MGIDKINKRLHDAYGGQVRAEDKGDYIVVTGRLKEWKDIVAACGMCVQKGKKNRKKHVVNDIVFEGGSNPGMRMPGLRDSSLDGAAPDVLIIGGGISGASIARELSRWQLDILLVEKEADLAVQSSGRNVGFTQWRYLPVIFLYVLEKKYRCKVKDTRLVGRKAFRRAEPELNPDFKFAIYNPGAGCVCPYGLTIAYGENAVENGARISLNTAVSDMEVKEGIIQCVHTNRGSIYPSLVINAAGTFAEDVAKMAQDRFYSIHPRRGTNSILDKKAGHLVRSISSVRTMKKTTGHTKGGGMLHTVDDNVLVGPDAVETGEKENFATEQASIDRVFAKQKGTSPGLTQRDIITYFTGVRAATFEEDFIIEMGRRTKNLIHCAGIQSPGLTTAPAVAIDVAAMAVKALSSQKEIKPNTGFRPNRKGIPRLRELPEEERDRLIRENPDYGVIICRCEEISKGEILDALNSPLPVCTVDGIKKRLRPGMGRCQGGFCMPLVAQIISEHEGIPLSRVKKSGTEAVISYGPTKG